MKFVTLGEITDNLDSKRVPLNSSERNRKSTERLYPYIGANNILEYIDEYIFDEKILCIAEDGGSWGKDEICAKIYQEKCWVNNHAHVLRAKNNVVLEYLAGYLNHANLNSYITGTTRGKLTRSKLDFIEIPLPPLDDQIRIASLLSKVANLISRRREQLKQLDELLKSVFLEMFGDPVRNEMGWKRVTIRDLILEAKYGTSKSAEGGKYKYLRMNNISTNGFWDFTSLKYIDIKDYEVFKYSLVRNDLVFNRTNSKELVGKTAVYASDEKVIIAGYLIRVRTKLEANPWYIWGYLNSKAGKLRLFNLCRNIVGMANINAQELQDIPILKPPIDLQNQFAEIVAKVESLRGRYTESLTNIESLYGTLSQKAFKGELDLSQVRHVKEGYVSN